MNDLFQRDKLHNMCAINETVHYGRDQMLMVEYKDAILTNRKNFRRRIPAFYRWYARRRSSRKTTKIAAHVYVTMLGAPQLFTEGNHRTGEPRPAPRQRRER
jgi:hypothetical protein